MFQEHVVSGTGVASSDANTTAEVVSSWASWAGAAVGTQVG